MYDMNTNRRVRTAVCLFQNHFRNDPLNKEVALQIMCVKPIEKWVKAILLTIHSFPSSVFIYSLSKKRMV